jgi:hypothetical protein
LKGAECIFGCIRYLFNIVEVDVYQKLSVDRIKERLCAAYAVRMVTTPEVVQATSVPNGRYSTHASTCDAKPKIARTSRNPHDNVLWSGYVPPTQQWMTRCIVSRQKELAAIKTIAAAPRRNYSLYNHRLTPASNLPHSALDKLP